MELSGVCVGWHCLVSPAKSGELWWKWIERFVGWMLEWKDETGQVSWYETFDFNSQMWNVVLVMTGWDVTFGCCEEG